MSRIGIQPVNLSTGVDAEFSPNQVTIKGPKGSISHTYPGVVSVKKEGSQIVVELKGKGKEAKSIFGTTRALIANMVYGVVNGWKKELELVGTGFRAEVSGKDLVLTVGFSHPVKIPAPEGISFSVEKMIVKVEGVDKELVGRIAAKIRDVKPPEPYKGKGIKYLDEVIRRKPGKAAAKAAVA